MKVMDAKDLQIRDLKDRVTKLEKRNRKNIAKRKKSRKTIQDLINRIVILEEHVFKNKGEKDEGQRNQEARNATKPGTGESISYN